MALEEKNFAKPTTIPTRPKFAIEGYPKQLVCMVARMASSPFPPLAETRYAAKLVLVAV